MLITIKILERKPLKSGMMYEENGERLFLIGLLRITLVRIIMKIQTPGTGGLARSISCHETGLPEKPPLQATRKGGKWRVVHKETCLGKLPAWDVVCQTPDLGRLGCLKASESDMSNVWQRRRLFSFILFYVCEIEVFALDDFSFIDNIKPNTYRQNKLIKGIGDDAAIFRMGNEDTVIAVDTVVEGVHFTKETREPCHIGHPLMAANLSDLAAMGAAPLFYLASVVIPDELPDADVLQIFSGMKKLADVYGVDLIGGDTTSGGLLTLSLTIIGSVPVGKARLRSDARPGDVVFVTGTLGDAGAGLDLLLNNIPVNCPEAEKRKLIKRHQLPTP